MSIANRTASITRKLCAFGIRLHRASLLNVGVAADIKAEEAQARVEDTQRAIAALHSQLKEDRAAAQAANNASAAVWVGVHAELDRIGG